jgi:HK97 family phage major capsid protein
MRFTTLPFLIAFMAGLLVLTPRNVYAVNAWDVGTCHVEPWRSTRSSTTPIARAKALLSRARDWCAGVAGHPDARLYASLAFAALVMVQGHHGAGLALLAGEAAFETVPGASKLKFYRQAAVDIDRKISDNAQRGAEIDRDLSALTDTVTTAKRAMTADEQTSFAALRAEKATNGTFRAGLLDSKADITARLQEAEAANEAERKAAAVPDPDDAAANRSAAILKGKKDGGFASFGERLQAVRTAAQPGGTVDKRLLAIAPGMNESNPSDGGFLVGQDQVTTVRQRMYETGQLLSRVFQLPIGPNSNGVKLMAVDETSRADGARYGGITSYWLDEGGTKTASKPKWRPMELSLKKVAALVRVTDELLADATALEAWIMKYLPLELKFKAEDAIVSGSGAGMPLGFLNSGATVAVARTTPGTIVYEDIVNMYSRFYGPSLSNANSAWFIDQSAMPALFSMSLQIGAGGIPVFLPANGIAGKPFSTLFGLPVIPAEYLSALGTKGDIMLADLSQYTLIDKGEVQSASSIHVYFVTDETAFRFVYRVDGQPEWNAPLTPKNGGPTLSPFVVLAT